MRYDLLLTMHTDIYLRMADVGFSTAPCTIATYTISAFWHVSANHYLLILDHSTLHSQ